MEPGLLRDSITIQKSTTTQDAEGNTSQSWSRIGDRKAHIRPLTSREFMDGAKTSEGHVSYEITIRYFDGLTGKHRIKFGDRIFNLNGPPRYDSMRRYQTFHAVEVVGALVS